MNSKVIDSYENAINHYLNLQEKQSKGVLTQREEDFVMYIDKHCYSGYNRSKRMSNPSDYVKNTIVKMKANLFV